MIIVRFNHDSATFQISNDALRHFTEIFFLNIVERTEVIIHMLLAGFCQTADTEDNLAGEIIPLIIIQSLFDGNIVFQMRYAQRTDTFYLLQMYLFLFYFVQDFTQLPEIFIHETMDGAVECIRGKQQYRL